MHSAAGLVGASPMGHNGGPPLNPPAPPPVPAMRPHEALVILAFVDMTERGLARRLKVTPSKARRWVEGQSPIPAVVAKWLRQLEADARANPPPNMGARRA